MKAIHLERKLVPFLCVALALLFGACANVGRQAPQASTGSGAAPPPAEDEGLVTVEGGRVAAELIATPAAIRAGDRLVLRVVNRGELGISFGRPLTVERWEGSAWVETPESRDAAWTMELLYVAPGGIGVEQPWPFLPDHQPDPGWYRFTKVVRPGVPNADQLTLRARVEVSK